MKQVLYLANIEVPYRVRFFNELAKYCDLTVLYERRLSSNRDQAWTSSEESQYHKVYLDGIPVSNENSFSLRIWKYITGKYDAIIVGCCNSPVQVMAILIMRLLKIPYVLNIDGEIHWKQPGLKNSLKRFVLKGAAKYLVAGEKAAESLRSVSSNAPIIPYYFSSLTDEELHQNAEASRGKQRRDTVLVVGQYFDYKGMDVALEAAKLDQSISYLFVGMGKRTELFRENFHTEDIPNVTIVPFLQKADLEKEYRTCAMLVLPSRQECWGLVINEAASFGTPIVSTWGSGAAVEFLSDVYPQYLAMPGDAASLLESIQRLRSCRETETYSCYLKETSQNYCIETSCQAHLRGLEI